MHSVSPAPPLQQTSASNHDELHIAIAVTTINSAVAVADLHAKARDATQTGVTNPSRGARTAFHTYDAPGGSRIARTFQADAVCRTTLCFITIPVEIAKGREEHISRATRP